MKKFASAFAGLALIACAPQADTPPADEQVDYTPDIPASAIEGHIRYLASDDLAGRDSGSEGYRLAAEYVAAQYAQLGLEPAGENGTYFQSVPLQEVMADGEYNQVEIDGQTYAHGEGVMVSTNPSVLESEVTGPLVYVGYGVSAPDRGYDDYADIDVEGAIVVVRGGIPEIFPSDERAHHNSGSTKRDIAASHGAIGMISLSGFSDEQIASFAERFGGRPSVRLTAESGESSYDQVTASATASETVSEALFANAEMTMEEAFAATDGEEASYPVFPLNMTATIRQRTLSDAYEDVNVAGILRGRDADLADEVVVLSAHLDHIGQMDDDMRANGACRSALSEDEADDLVCNGALDNASGIAIMIETARTFIEHGEGRRSVLFVAVAAEEKGLLGSDHFARNPTVPSENMVANVNLDMPVIAYEFSDVIAFGAEHSNLGPIASRATERLGVEISPDPIPEQNLFVRSDHYSFVREGVPALFLMTGFSSPDPRWDQGEGFMGFLNTHYHRATDELDGELDVLFDQGAKFANINYIIAREIAESDQSPQWNEDSFFGQMFGRD